MAILSFDAQSVHRIITHTKSSPDHSMGWSDAPNQPAVVLAGDQGVYLMSNGEPRDTRATAPDRTFVAYARGINPDMDAGWWEAKRASFGGDDGAETLLIIDQLQILLERGEAFIRFEISNEHIAILMPDVTWVQKGTMVEVPSGLGGVFKARVLSITETHASLQNSGNSEDFDDAPPYLVPLGHLKPVQTREVA